MMKLGINERYRIIRKLGDGGMGEVYLVEHQELGRREALKFLRKGLNKSQEFVSRFRREARALNRLKHANIVCVYDFGTLPDGGFYLSTEYADGTNLRTLIEQEGALPVARAVRILVQLASAVTHAHTRGVIHRDLKPENLILEKDFRDREILKVLDFGIAKIVAPDYKDTAEVTRRGAIQGTPQYMSPEQVRGEGNDLRIDIYAVGCIAFELVAGTPPFNGLNALDIMRAHAFDEPPGLPKDRRLDPIPDDYEALVFKCLAKDPDARFQSGRDLLEALEQIPGATGKDDDGAATRPVQRKSQTIILHNPVPVVDEFDEDTTMVDGPRRYPTERRRRAGSVSRTLTNESLTMDQLILDLARLLVELGCDAVMLSVQLSLVQELQDELDRWGEEIDELEQRRVQVEQRSMHNEATLRFSLSELLFERERAKDRDMSLAARLDPHILSLERRLAQATRVLEGELRTIDDRKAFLVATYMDKEKDLDTVLFELQELLSELAAPFTYDGEVARMLAQLEWVGQTRPG